MKKSLLLLSLLFATAVCFAQPKGDGQLNQRLETYMQLSRELKFDALMDYIHPALFKLASKAEILEIFKSAFDNVQMQMRFDSTSVTTISETFTHAGGQYKKVDYYMEMSMKFKDTTLYKSEEFMNAMNTGLTGGFPGATITFNKTTKAFNIKGANKLIAIKEVDGAWLFLGIDQSNAGYLDKLLPKEVITHFKLL